MTSGTKNYGKTKLRVGGDSAGRVTRERARHETRSNYRGDERELKPHGAGLLYPRDSVIMIEVAAVVHATGREVWPKVQDLVQVPRIAGRE
jgi:hypothetical protein